MRLWKRKDKAGKPRRKIRKLRLLTLILVLGILGFGAFVFGVVTAIAEEIPKLDPAYQQRIAKNSYVYSSDGKRVLAVIRGAESRVIVPSRDIAPVMKQAIVAIEDRRFFEHRGVDLHAIFRAVWADITSGNVVQGGSTITQQFIKNAYVHSAPSISRKLKEAALAWQLEQKWSKDRILSAYLNTIYFGNGAYGIQQAAQTYFQHSAKALTLPEAALLAGIPQDPALYDPVANPHQAAAAARRGAAHDVPAGGHHHGRAARREQRRPPRAQLHPSPRNAGAGAVLRQLREAAARRPLRIEPGLRRRPERDDDDRPRPAAISPRRRSRSG